MIYLHGGGWAEDESSWTGLFVAEAARRLGRTPTVTVVLWSQTPEDGYVWHDDYRDDLARLGAGGVDIIQLCGDDELSVDALTGVEALVVGGGLTPGYHRAVLPAAAGIRSLVESGVPYLGVSAGAMIAGETALLGGWRLDGVPLVPAEYAEGLDEVTLGPGLGLCPFVVDAHAGLGLLARTTALVSSGAAAAAVALDENALAVVGQPGTPAATGTPRAAGIGAVWHLTPAGDGAVTVRRLRASHP